MRTRALAILATLALVGTGCGAEEEDAAAGGGDQVTVEMSAQNGSGESGTATLTADGDSATTVVIELANGAAEPQPAHIHAGTCADLDPNPAFGLSNVVDGRSETTVNAPLADLQGKAYAVNVHKSATEAEIYVSCGEIGGTGGSPDSGTTRDYRY
jgi:hypothetical protein